MSFGPTSTANARVRIGKSIYGFRRRGLDGFDTGKNINTASGHTVTDTKGHLAGLQVDAVDIQNRNGTVAMLASLRWLYRGLRHIFADSGYAGDKLRDALTRFGRWMIAIMRRLRTSQALQPPAPINNRPDLGLDEAADSPTILRQRFACAVAPGSSSPNIRILTRRLARTLKSISCSASDSLRGDGITDGGTRHVLCHAQ